MNFENILLLNIQSSAYFKDLLYVFILFVWLLVVVGCCWLLLVAVGCWLLVAGCWLLVAGCWLLGMSVGVSVGVGV